MEKSAALIIFEEALNELMSSDDNALLKVFELGQLSEKCTSVLSTGEFAYFLDKIYMHFDSLKYDVIWREKD